MCLLAEIDTEFCCICSLFKYRTGIISLKHRPAKNGVRCAGMDRNGVFGKRFKTVIIFRKLFIINADQCCSGSGGTIGCGCDYSNRISSAEDLFITDYRVIHSDICSDCPCGPPETGYEIIAGYVFRRNDLHDAGSFFRFRTIDIQNIGMCYIRHCHSQI